MATNANLKSYALAIFDVAKTKQTQQKYFVQIKQLDELNTQIPEFAKVLSTITIAKDSRKELAKEVLSQLDFDQNVIYWVWTILDSNNYHNYHYIFKECEELHHEIFNITTINVTSASELSQTQIEKIKDFFENKLHTSIDLHLHVNPTLIGGIKMQLNNKTYNNTVKNKLDSLKQQLLSKKG